MSCARARVVAVKVHAELFAAAFSKGAIMEAGEGGKDGEPSRVERLGTRWKRRPCGLPAGGAHRRRPEACLAWAAPSGAQQIRAAKASIAGIVAAKTTTARARLPSNRARESVLFIGTQFSNLYTAVDTPAKGRVGSDLEV